MFRSIRPLVGEWSSFRFLEEGVLLSGEDAADEDAAARCMNFIVKSLDETALGVSGAIAEEGPKLGLCLYLRKIGIFNAIFIMIGSCAWSTNELRLICAVDIPSRGSLSQTKVLVLDCDGY